MDLYAQNIIEHYKQPRNHGRLAEPKISGKQMNRSCGDQLAVDLRIKDDQIEDLKFEANGCAISVAAMSILSEKLIGQNITEVLAINYQSLLDMLGLPVGERRYKCVLLGLITVQNIILAEQKNPLRTWDDLM
ncbi:iron-sulfur cluster assembly scaffold protein [Candidatus Nomurabacteria bacterium]|nr:iron-sulfur cluster assembly scaffold protein [Candidatus Nomurabacteria bacterium]